LEGLDRFGRQLGGWKGLSGARRACRQQNRENRQCTQEMSADSHLDTPCRPGAPRRLSWRCMLLRGGFPCLRSGAWLCAIPGLACSTLLSPVPRRSGGTAPAGTQLLNTRLSGYGRDRIFCETPSRAHSRGLKKAAKPSCGCSRKRRSREAVSSIHSSCGKPCGKTGSENWNSLISNEKDQAAHKWVYCCKLLNINILINQTKISVPVGEHSVGTPAITGFSTIGLRECPTGRGFWRSDPCRSNSCKAFARKDAKKRCLPCYGSSRWRVPSWVAGKGCRGERAGNDGQA